MRFPCSFKPAVFVCEVSCREPSLGGTADIFDTLCYIRMAVYSVMMSLTNGAKPFGMFLLVSLHETFCSGVGLTDRCDGYPVIREDVLIDEECDEIRVVVGCYESGISAHFSKPLGVLGSVSLCGTVPSHVVSFVGFYHRGGTHPPFLFFDGTGTEEFCDEIGMIVVAWLSCPTRHVYPPLGAYIMVFFELFGPSIIISSVFSDDLINRKPILVLFIFFGRTFFCYFFDEGRVVVKTCPS